jgi:sigma-B regulation protein RsbU (phosphoserine phosphatase)
MLVLGALCVMGNMMWFNNRVIDPIIKLGNSMIAFAGSSDDNSSGNELKVIDPGITTNDEMQTLSVQAVDMMNKVIKHIERTRLATAEKERMSAELSVSTKIQRDMLPTHFPARSDFGLYALMTPAKEMGGDFYDFFMIDDDHIGLVIADVSGKGVPAAMFMIVARTLMKIRTVASGTPSEMLRDINIKLCEDNPAELFVTIWFGILTLSTGELISSNAGHEYPALMRSGGEFGLLVSENMPPVAVDSSLTYTDETIRLHKGDKLFLYTDGIPEAKNIDGFRLGTDNMLDILNRNRNKSPEELLGSVKREVDLFAGNCDQFDDITMMSLEWKADT